MCRCRDLLNWEPLLVAGICQERTCVEEERRTISECPSSKSSLLLEGARPGSNERWKVLLEGFVERSGVVGLPSKVGEWTFSRNLTTVGKDPRGISVDAV